MYVKIKASGIKAFVNNVSIQVGSKVYTLSEPETGNPIWNGDRRTFDESQVTELKIVIELDSDPVKKEPLYLAEGEEAIFKALDNGIKNVIAPK